MRYKNINSLLFQENRLKFTSKLLPKSIAVFNSNDVMPTNADGTMGFRQNNDLFYLSGIDQEETILVLFSDCFNQKHREILFVKETNELIAIWEGNKLTKSEVSEISQIGTVYWLHQFQSVFKTLVLEAEHIYLNSNEHTRSDNKVETRDDRFIRWCKKAYPLHKYERSAPILQELRSVKSRIEIELIKIASGITEKGFRRILPMVKPGMMEFEIEAEFTHEFIRSRSSGHAYHPIIASGADSCILHYVKNDKECKSGDILLLDVGAAYANYASDMTRCIPIGGKFTVRQKEVYNAVLRIMRQAIQFLVPENTFEKYTAEVNKLFESELVGLGLISANDIKNQDPENPLFKKYFMHGISHFLGLDVHDVGDRSKPFKAGMVLTCEPGIYIPQESLGIRLENNILITDNGPIDLMANIPIEADEIESLMN